MSFFGRYPTGERGRPFEICFRRKIWFCVRDSVHGNDVKIIKGRTAYVLRVRPFNYVDSSDVGNDFSHNNPRAQYISAVVVLRRAHAACTIMPDLNSSLLSATARARCPCQSRARHHPPHRKRDVLRDSCRLFLRAYRLPSRDSSDKNP